MQFSDDEIRRYARQMVLPEVGGLGQARLRSAHVRASGEIEAAYLRAAGVGQVEVRGSEDDVETQCLRALATLKEILAL